MFARGKALVAVVLAILTIGSSMAVGLAAFPVSDHGGSVAATPAAASVAAPTVNGVSSNPTNGYTLTASPTRAAAVNTARQAFVNDGISLNDFLPPNLNSAPAAPSQTGGHIVPLYNYAPAPMGVATFGLANRSGTVTPYILNTTSVEGTFTTTDPLGIQAQSLYYGTQEAWGAQLNTVLVGTTVNHNSSYDYWLQNVIQYTTSASTGQLSFVLNIWNFSSNTFYFPSNSILHGNGRVESSEVYEASGPSVTIQYPFTLDLYLNTTVGSYAGSPLVNEVYFNYSVYNSLGQHVCPASEPSGDVCGMYDNVYFNSQQAVTPGSAEIQANGYNYNPSGLPTDMEMDYGIGQSDGANANDVYADATVGLFYLNASTHTYNAPPSTYDFGSETGETGIGAMSTWNTVAQAPDGSLGIANQPEAAFHTGPSLLQGLWNTSTPSGQYALNYAGVTPTNAFVAIAPGTGVTNQSYFQVAPTFGWFTPGGSIGPNIWLSPGLYTVEVMLSGYNEETQNVDLTTSGATLSVALGVQATPTVYTPLWAFGNAQLANLAVSGSGTLESPYIMPSSQPGSLSPVFAVLNDYLFEVYSGIYLNATTAYVNFNPAPSLNLVYPSWWVGQLESLGAAYGAIPLTNTLPIYLFQAQNVTIANTPSISLWSFNQASRYYSVYVNGGKNDLFYGNDFNVSSAGLDFLGGGANQHNYVFGNTFTPFNDANYPGMNSAGTGLTVSESGDHIYNNAFYTNATATATGRSGRTTINYLDFWNATGGYQPSTNSIMVNGWTLGNAANILGQNFLGGNYWFNYGALANPYAVPYVARTTSATGTAGIGIGADYAPLTPYLTTYLAPTIPGAFGLGLYQAWFSESGLVSGQSWTLRVSPVPVALPNVPGIYNSAETNTTIALLGGGSSTFYLPNGTYTWSFAAKPTGSVPSVSTGTFTVNGSTVVVPQITFNWTVTFTESGLGGLQWAAVLGGKLGTTTGTSLVFTVNPGTYAYSVSAIPAGWTATPSSGSLTAGSTVSVSVTFAPSAPPLKLFFTASGIYSGTSWSVTIGSTTLSSTGSTIMFTLTPGTYSYTVSGIPAGYTATPSSGSVTLTNVGTSVGIVFTPITYTVTFTESGLNTGTFWAVQLGGVILGSTSISIVFTVTPGTYAYLIGFMSGSPATPSSGSVTVTNTAMNVAIAFA